MISKTLRAAFIGTLFFSTILAINSTGLSPIFAQDKEASEEKEKPKQVHIEHLEGSVKNGGGKPIADVEIKIQCSQYDYETEKWSKPQKWETKTDSSGKYKVEIDSEFPSDGTNLTVRATKEGYIVGKKDEWLDDSFKGKIKVLVLKRGIAITGKVIAPDGSGDAPESAVVRIGQKASSNWQDYNKLFEKKVECDAEGEFKLVAPEGEKFILVATAENYSAVEKRIEIPNRKTEDQTETHELENVELKRGAKITGVFLDRDGLPKAGVVIRAKRDITIESRNNIGSVSAWAKTDVEGYFELTPQLGKCVITTTERGRVKGEQIETDGDLPRMTPFKLTVREDEESVDIELQEAQVFTIRGRISSKDDERHLKNIQMIYGPEGEGQESVEVDDDGNYEFKEIAETPGTIFVFGSERGGYYMARITTESLKKHRDVLGSSSHRSSQAFRYKGFTYDIDDLNFDLKFHGSNESNGSSWADFVDWYFYGNEND